MAEDLALVSSAVAREGEDQASGLRRLVQVSGPQWTLVLMAGMRNADVGGKLLPLIDELAREAGRVLVIDAARVQVGAAAGLGLRYDLDHALRGDCDTAEACVQAGERIWILPAGRAMDAAATDAAGARTVAEALVAIGAGFDHVVLLLPAARSSWVRRIASLRDPRRAVVPVWAGPEATTSVLSAIRAGVSDAEIADFHLLFLGLGEATAGRLLSGMAAIAQRHFGARVSGARSFAGGSYRPGRPARARPRGSTESGF